MSSTLLLTAKRKRLTLVLTNQKLWLSCLLSVSLLNLCLSLPGTSMTHPKHISHASSYTCCPACLQISSMSQTHTCSKHRLDEFQPHKFACEQHMLHTRTQSAPTCMSHTCSCSLHTGTHKQMFTASIWKCMSIVSPSLPSFASLLL